LDPAVWPTNSNRTGTDAGFTVWTATRAGGIPSPPGPCGGPLRLHTDELGPVEQRHLREREQCLALSNGLLDQAVARGQLPVDTDTRMAAHMLYGFIGGLMRDWVQSPGSFDMKVAAPQAVELFLAGLRAAPPRRPASA